MVSWGSGCGSPRPVDIKTTWMWPPLVVMFQKKIQETPSKHGGGDSISVSTCDFELIVVLRSRRSIPIKNNTFSNGCLGYHDDEGRSEMRYVMRIAKSSESSNLWTQLALQLAACFVECLFIPIPLPTPPFSLFWEKRGVTRGGAGRFSLRFPLPLWWGRRGAGKRTQMTTFFS